MLSCGIFPENLLIYTAKQAAIKCLTSVVLTYILSKSEAAIKSLTKHSKKTLVWTPEHKVIVGNCIANELAKADMELT